MAVSKQAYTVSAPWLNTNLATIFRNAFIDANLMADWHDSFQTTSDGQTSEHRVLRIIYDASKKYGTVYHRFVFRPNGSMDYAMSHTWDLDANAPTGDANKDYVSGGDNAFRVFATQVLSTTTTLTRYTSGIRTNFSMFVLKGGSNSQCFFLLPSGTAFQPYINLDLNTCNGLMVPAFGSVAFPDTDTNQYFRYLHFAHLYLMGNNIFSYGYSSVIGETFNGGTLANSWAPGVTYMFTGAGSSNFANPQISPYGAFNSGDKVANFIGNSATPLAIALPAELASANSNRNADSTPVFSDLPYSIYTTDRLPIDFGIVGHYSNSTMEIQDIFQVTAGIEEWEILTNYNNTSIANPSMLVVARTI